MAPQGAVVVPLTPADVRDQHWLDERIDAIEDGIEAVLDIARNWADLRGLSRLHPGVSAQEYVLAHVQHPLGPGVVVPLLAESNWSNVQIAAVAGVSEGTVRATSQKYEVERPAKTLGADGKLRPARVIRTVTAEVIEPAPEPAPEPEAEQEDVPIAAPDPTTWRSLVSVMEAIEALDGADEMAAGVPERRKAATARRLRKLGTSLGRIAWTLEGRNELP